MRRHFSILEILTNSSVVKSGPTCKTWLPVLRRLQRHKERGCRLSSSHRTALSFWVRSIIIVILSLFCALALQATKKIIIKIFKVSFENFLEEISILSIHPLKTSWFCLPITSLFFFKELFFSCFL